MELNREQLVKALECCTNCSCNHADDDTECPLVKMSFCQNYLMKQSLAIIKELTEENERLKIAFEKTHAVNVAFERFCKGNCQECQYAIWETQSWYHESKIVDCKITRSLKSWCFLESEDTE